MMLRDLARKLIAHEHIKRISHSHTLHNTHEVDHMAYLVGIILERGGFHAVVGGVMLVCSCVVLLGGEDHNL